MSSKRSASRVPMAELTDVQRDELERIHRDAFLHFEGSFDDIEKAIGILYLGHHIGWKPLVLMHSKKTIAKYEEILGITFREFFPEEGPSSDRSVAWTLAKKLKNFWKAVSGETPVPDRQQFIKGTAKGT